MGSFERGPNSGVRRSKGRGPAAEQTTRTLVRGPLVDSPYERGLKHCQGWGGLSNVNKKAIGEGAFIYYNLLFYYYYNRLEGKLVLSCLCSRLLCRVRGLSLWVECDWLATNLLFHWQNSHCPLDTNL